MAMGKLTVTGGGHILGSDQQLKGVQFVGETLSHTHIRMDFTQTGSERVDSGQCQVANSGEYGTEPPHSTTVDEFLDKLSDSQLLKNSAPRSIDRFEEPVALESQSPHCILYCEGCQFHLVRFTQQSVP
jgi:hypothetical protein